MSSPDPRLVPLTFYMREAHRASLNSSDPSTKCGCVLVGMYGIVAAGYNQLVQGTPEEFWRDRPLKYTYVIHAEVDALTKLMHSPRHHAPRSLTMYGTPGLSCCDCAKFIVHTNLVGRIVYDAGAGGGAWRDDLAVHQSVATSRRIFSRANIELVEMSWDSLRSELVHAVDMELRAGDPQVPESAEGPASAFHRQA